MSSPVLQTYSCEISGNLALFKELQPVLILAYKNLAFSVTGEITVGKIANGGTYGSLKLLNDWDEHAEF